MTEYNWEENQGNCWEARNSPFMSSQELIYAIQDLV